MKEEGHLIGNHTYSHIQLTNANWEKFKAELIKTNEIILMHDYYAASVTAALSAIDRLKEEGYMFVTVEEILFD